METPVAPAAAAPATPTPAATPAAATPTPAPAAPAAAQPTPAPAAAPDAQQPSAPAAEPAAPQGAPKAEDFPSTTEGLEQFIEASERWKMENPEAAEAAAEEARKQAELNQPGQQPVEEQKPAEEKAPEEKPAEAPPAEVKVEQVTPQQLAEAFEKHPAVKAALDAAPEAKALLMETARAAEAARPIVEVFPTAEEARFAATNANQFIELQHKFALSGFDPEVGEAGFQDFKNLFNVVDAEGKPVLENGKPVMTDSYGFLTGKIVNERLGDLGRVAREQLNDLRKRVESGVYPNEQAKQADQHLLETAELEATAFDLVAEALNRDSGEIKLPELSADATPEQRALQQQLARQVEEANKGRQKGGQEARTREFRAYQAEVHGSFGAGVGEYVDNEIAARKARGEYIPDFVLNRKWVDPTNGKETNFPSFAVEIMNSFNAKIHSLPGVNNKLLQLEFAGPAGRQALLDYYATLRRDYLPGIVDRSLKTIQDGIRGMQATQNIKLEKVATVAAPEPQTASIPQPPKPLTGEALEQQALQNISNRPEYQQADRTEQYAMLIEEKVRIQSGGK